MSNNDLVPWTIKKFVKQILLDWTLSWKEKEQRIEELYERTIESCQNFLVLKAIHQFIERRLTSREAQPMVGRGCTKRNDNPTALIPACYTIPPSTERGKRR